MKVINNNTVVVFSSSELKNVLEGTNEYSYIYFGDNITLESGIKIANSKEVVTIDGTYEGVRYTFTDKKSLASSDTISISYPTILNVKVCNLDVVGYNYYGVISVSENNNYKNVLVEYNNIIYNGPQLSFNPSGLTRIIDSDITISDGDLTVGNEVAECNRIEIGGITNIVHNSKSNSAFWFRNSNPSFKILSNAVVNFTSEYRELFYGVSNLEFSILSNSYFSVTSHSGMAYGNNGTGVSNIFQNSEFILKQTASNGNYPTWYSYGTITLNDNSSLTIINDYEKISSANYNITFSNNGGFILNNPKMVVLYNTSANVISAGSSIPFDFKFSRINLFLQAIKMDDEISLSTLPDYSWYKNDSSAVIKGKFNSNSVDIESHNFTEQELANLPSLDSFIFANKKIFSVGDFSFLVNSVTDSDTVISGITEKLSSILISINDVNTVVLADSSGNFSYNYDKPLDIGTIITFNVKLSDNAIYHTKVIQIIYSGEIVLASASKVINFKLEPISNNPILCPRNGEMIVNVVDSRVNYTNWKLYACVNHELISNSDEVFDGNLIYKNSNGDIFPLSDKPTLVYTDTENKLNTVVNWNDDEGILLMVNEKIISGKEYSANIIWSIEE